MAESFPRLWARTGRFTLGQPRAFDVVGDRPDGGVRIFFLRALAGDDPRTGLWALDVPPAGDAGEERLLIDPSEAGDEALTDAERARRERARETASGAVAFSRDDTGRWVLAQLSGRTVLVDADTGGARNLPVPAAAYDVRLDPTGQRVGYVMDDGVYVVEVSGGAAIRVAGDDPADGASGAVISWGRAEHAAAEEMGRLRGWWWSPDGTTLLVTRVDESALPLWWMADPAHPDAPPRPVRFPAAGGPNAAVSLWLVPPDGAGTRTQVRWDSATFEYLAAVTWDDPQPVLTVQSRNQQRVQWLTVAADGTTHLLAEDHARPWVELHPGAGRRLHGDLVRISDVEGRRWLLIGERAVSPAEVHLRSVAGTLGDGVVVTGSPVSDPGSVGVWWIGRDGATTALADAPGLHTATVGGPAVVVGHLGPDSALGSWRVLIGDEERARVGSRVLPPPYRPEPHIFTTNTGVRVGVVLPRSGAGGDLPVLMYPYGGPHGQRVTASARDWLESQWWAEQGFAVVVVDGRGTPGVSVAFEQAVHLDIADVVLADQVEGLRAAAERMADLGVRLDLQRVGIRGWSFGGFLAALAVLRRPDVFHAAVAGAPPTDWRLYDTHYTERYLGTDTTAAAYDSCALLDDARNLSRPLLLVHGLADDNVVVANTLRLSQALTEAGRAHSVLPLSGVTHMTPQEAVAENLLLLQRDFLRDALGAG